MKQYLYDYEILYLYIFFSCPDAGPAFVTHDNKASLCVYSFPASEKSLLYRSFFKKKLLQSLYIYIYISLSPYSCLYDIINSLIISNNLVYIIHINHIFILFINSILVVILFLFSKPNTCLFDSSILCI